MNENICIKYQSIAKVPQHCIEVLSNFPLLAKEPDGCLHSQVADCVCVQVQCLSLSVCTDTHSMHL